MLCGDLNVLKAETLLCWQRSVESQLWSSQWSHTVVRAELLRKQNAKELIPLNCNAGEDSWKSLGQQGDQTNLEGDQSWIFTRRTNAEAEALVFWSSDVNRRLIGKVPDAGKDQGQKEKRASEGEIGGWHHQCSDCELGQTLGDGEGQGGLVCCPPWGCK